MVIDPFDGSAQVLGGRRSHPVSLLATPPCTELPEGVCREIRKKLRGLNEFIRERTK